MALVGAVGLFHESRIPVGEVHGQHELLVRERDEEKRGHLHGRICGRYGLLWRAAKEHAGDYEDKCRQGKELTQHRNTIRDWCLREHRNSSSKTSGRSDTRESDVRFIDGHDGLAMGTFAVLQVVSQIHAGLVGSPDHEAKIRGFHNLG